MNHEKMTQAQKEKLRTNIQGKWWDTQHANNLSEQLISCTADGIELLPAFFQKTASTAFVTIGLWLSRMIQLYTNLINPTYQINIKLQKDTHNLTLLYQGDKSSGISFVKQFIQNHSSPSIIIEQIKKQKTTEKVDMILLKTDRFFTKYFQRKGYRTIPEYVSMMLDISPPISEILTRASPSIQRDIKTAKEKGYSYEITDRKEDFIYFYHQIYVPYTTWKHKDNKRIATLGTIRHLRLQGAKLLLLKLHDEIIFGGMFIIKNRNVTTQYAGLKKGKFDHIHQGIMAFSYYSLIEIAKKNGCTSIDFGTARPFLKDGLLTYKAKWNMRPIMTPGFFSDILSFKILNGKKSIERIFKNNPCIMINDDRFALLHVASKDQGKSVQYSSNAPIKKQMESIFLHIDEI